MTTKHLTKNLISRKDAMAISPDYVAFVEGDFDKFDVVYAAFEKLKRGQAVITYDSIGKVFVRAKITSINHNDFRAVDGPIVRVSNGEFSWRVDGSGYAWPAS